MKCSEKSGSSLMTGHQLPHTFSFLVSSEHFQSLQQQWDSQGWNPQPMWHSFHVFHVLLFLIRLRLWGLTLCQICKVVFPADLKFILTCDIYYIHHQLSAFCPSLVHVEVSLILGSEHLISGPSLLFCSTLSYMWFDFISGILHLLVEGIRLRPVYWPFSLSS